MQSIYQMKLVHTFFFYKALKTEENICTHCIWFLCLQITDLFFKCIYVDPCIDPTENPQEKTDSKSTAQNTHTLPVPILSLNLQYTTVIHHVDQNKQMLSQAGEEEKLSLINTEHVVHCPASLPKFYRPK